MARMLVVAVSLSLLVGCSAARTTSPEQPPSPAPTAAAQPAGSGSGESQSGDSSATSAFVAVPAEPRLDAATTARLLADPDRSVAGIWSVAANLGLGVYTPDGAMLLAGSEAGPGDIFLFDFEVGLLARRSAERSIAIEDVHALFQKLGVDIDLDTLLAEYRRIYLDERADAWLSSLLRESGVTFEDDTILTPLEAWLLLLDALVPPNGAATAGTPARLAVSTGPRTAADDAPCDFARGDDADPAWSIVWQVAGQLSDALGKAHELAYNIRTLVNPAAALTDPEAALVNILHALIMYIGSDLELTADRIDAHERHPGDPATPVTFTLRATYDPGAVPAWVTSCMTLLGFDVPSAGPIKDLGVEWGIDKTLTQHGTSNLGGATRVLTDASGKSTMEWVPRKEPSKGEGSKKEAVATVTAKVQVQKGDVFNPWAGIQELLLPRTLEKQVTVGWHDRAWKLMMHLSRGDPDNYLEWVWEGDFTVDEDNEIAGAGIGRINGAGHCEVEENGTVTYEGTTHLYQGLFLFEISGEQRGQDFYLQIDAHDANGSWKSKDSRCEGLFDLAERFGPLIAENIRGGEPVGYFSIAARDGASTWFSLEELGRLTLTVHATSN